MTAADLTLVGLSEDGLHLLLAAADGGRYRVPLDAELRAAVRQDHRRPASGPAAELSPREVQALIRGGASADEVAELSGWSREKIDKYEGPILAEREFVASLATQVRLRTITGSTLLATRVAERLAQRGVDPAAASWDAWRAVGRPWTLQLAFPAGGRLRQALWSFDVPTRAVTPEDDEARWLSGEDGPSRPAPFVPLNGTEHGPAHDVYDIEADGGLQVGAPADVVAAPPEPGPDLAPERPRTAARRHEGDEDADLEATMRERARSRRRRAKAPVAPAAPVAGQPMTPPVAAEPVADDVEQRPGVETERPVAEPPAPTPAPTQASSELGAAVDAVLAAAEAEGRDPVAEVTSLHEEATDVSEPVGESSAADAVTTEASPADLDDDFGDFDDPAAEAQGLAPTAAPQTEDDIASVLDAIDQRAAGLAGTPDEPSEEMDDADAQVLDARAPVGADPGGEAADGIEATLAAIDAQEAALAGSPDEADADEGVLPADVDAVVTEPSAEEPAPLDDAVDALVEEAQSTEVPAPAAARPAPANPATGRTTRRNRKKSSGASAQRPVASTTSQPTPSPEPEPAPAQQEAPSRSAGKRKGRASVPSWDDIMFGPKG